MSDFILKPSDFAFTYDGCKRCFYYKVIKGVKTPLVLPSIFKKIDQLTIDFFEGKNVKDIDKSLPEGWVKFGDKKVKSKPLRLDGGKSDHTVTINGKIDTIVEFDDETFGIVDFKTSSINDKKAKIYSRQLHAYAIALENPADNFTKMSPVSRLGLFVMEPYKLTKGQPKTKVKPEEEKEEQKGLLTEARDNLTEEEKETHDKKKLKDLDDDQYSLVTKAEWIEIPRDDEKFKKFLLEVVALLGSNTPPAKVPKKEPWHWSGCQECYWWCKKDKLDDH